MIKFLRAHAGQFSLYACSGATAVVMDFSTYFLLLHFGVWYVVATFIGGFMGFITAFLLHKYVVFKKGDDFLRHLGRYFLVDCTNNVIMAGILMLLVEHWAVDPRPARLVALIPIILWNFFVYKMFVYV